jgi:hypothetical protein
MKTFVKPLIFIAILFGLSGLAYWDDWQTKKEAKLNESKNKLLSIDPESIVKLDYTKVEDTGQVLNVKMVKEGSSWKIISPIDFPGDSEGVTRLLKTFEDLRSEKTLESSIDKLKDFGLDKPRITLSMTDKDNQQKTVQIGAKSPVGYSSYVRINESVSVNLVNHYAYTASNKEVFDFRDKGLRLPNLAEVKAIGFQHESDPIITLKRIDKDWLIESPQKFRADANEVKNFLTFFEKQRIEKFMDDPSPALKKALSGEVPGTKRIATLVLTNADDKLTNYALLENNGQIYTTMADYPGILILDKKIKDGLKKTLADFQDRAMFNYNSTEATELERDGQIFVKKGDKWFKKDGEEEADFVRLLLVDFEFAKADLVLTAAEATAKMQSSPQHSVKITFKDGKKLEFSVWKLPGDPEHLAIKVMPDGYFIAAKQLLENFEPKPKMSEKLQPGDQG